MKFTKFHLMMSAFEKQNSSNFVDVYFEAWDTVLSILNYSETELLNDLDKNWDLTDKSNVVISRAN